MAATVADSKTVTKDLAPHLTAAVLTALLATPIEALTVAQLQLLTDAVKRVSKGGDPTQLVGALLT